MYVEVDAGSLYFTHKANQILCASPTYLTKNGTPETPESLSEHQCLSYSYVEDPGSWHLFRDGKLYSVPIISRVTTSAGQVLSSAAVEGLGIAYGPMAFFRDQLASGVVKQVLPDDNLPRASIYSLFARSRYVPAKISTFNSFMEKFYIGRIYRTGPPILTGRFGNQLFKRTALPWVFDLVCRRGMQ